MTSNGTEFVGWTESPDGRGTYDIILTCLITTFLCCWSSVYPNIPGPDDSAWAAFRDKLGLACLGLLGPDFIIVLAIGQRSSARRSVRKFHAVGYKQWTMTHAFFADMGGFVLKAPDLSRPLPLNAEQLFYLVRNHYVQLPSTTRDELKDRDKSDGLARFLILCQVIWFIVNLIARAVEGLFITTMELTTLSFVVILFGTAWCWKDKPSDVTTAIPIETSTGITIEKIIGDGGPRATQPYYQTPLDFISRDEIALNLAWHYYNDLARKALFSPFSRRVKKVPWDRIPGDMFLRMDIDLELVGAAFIFLFSIVFLFAWNFDFPSKPEMILWRASSIYMMTYGAVGALWMELSMWVFVPQSREAGDLQPSIVEESVPTHPIRKWLEEIQRWWRGLEWTSHQNKSQDSFVPLETPEETSPGFFSRSHNISPNKDPRLGVQVGFLLVTSAFCSFYCIFRSYILIEDIIGLRSLPASAYESIDWARVIPHF
ncbi:hypothetical protein ACJ41O_006900 [Fusarium nematophilum]